MISNERILFYVSCFVFALTVFEILRKVLFIKNAGKTEGEIINICTYSSTDGLARSMRVKFSSEGTEYFIQSGLVANKAFVGEVLEVIFNEDNPNKAYVNSWLNLFIWELVIFIVSISAIFSFYNA